jgi:hypothetical protein
MKKNSTMMLLLLLLSSVYSQVLGTVHWHGGSAPNVLNENLEITSHEVSLGHITTIRAITTNIEVTLTKDAEIEGQSNSILFLEADFGHTIRFHVSHKLEFEDVVVIQYGLGTVEFVYDDGQKVVLKQGKHDVGTQWWIVMDEAVAGQAPTLHFTRSSTNQSEHNYLTIRSKSLISFLGNESNSAETGRVLFTPTNEGLGRFVLDIHDKGAFLVAGHTTTETNPADIRQDDIDKTTPAAGTPVFEIDNSSVSGVPSNLLVLNENNTWFDLLIDPFYNLNTRDPLTNYTGVFDGIRYGFVLGVASTTLIQPNSYLDYVALSLNQDIQPHIPGALPDVLRSLIKQRNPSALVIDGSHNPIFANRSAQIIFSDQAAIVLRSGVSEDGTVLDLESESPFTVLPDETTPGAGNWVLDVEGELRTSGSSADTNKIEVLSLFVQPTGGQLLIGNTGFPIFPLRTFATEPFSNSFEQYNKGAILVNNEMKLDNVTLEHTDFNHTVIAGDDVNSEPTYVGGETFTLNPISDEYGFVEISDVTQLVPRPSIQFENSVFNIHTDVASTGVDFLVTTAVNAENIGTTNFSQFVFFNNGPEVDNGTGRQWIMGTLVGSKAIDNSTVINSDSHLDIIQDEDFIDVGEEIAQRLALNVAENTEDIVPVIGNTSKKSIHTLYLGWNSNISIGTNADSTGFLNDLNPILLVDDNYFSFDSRGGSTRQPAETGTTGEGGIFVDLNGIFDFNNQIIVSIATTVTKSRNGLILLDKRQVFFDFWTGISTWKPDMSVQTILVAPNELLAEYTLNWIDIKKDYSQFTPYEVGDITILDCPPVLEENVTAIPTIQGTVDQLQIQGTRIGDPAHILFDGCHVRETIFYDSELSAEAPVAVFVLRNDARVGIGCADQNVVSDYATTMLGVNGIQIIVDSGSGFIHLNEDVYINNICSILKGPNFVSGVDRLRIYSAIPREIRVKPEGVLDITDFDDLGDVIEILGDVRIVLEPGGTIIFGGGTFLLNDDTQLIFEASQLIFDDINNIALGAIDNTLSPAAIVPADEPHNEFAALTGFENDLQNTNPYRVRLIGTGTLALTGSAQAFIPNGAIVGVETLSTDSGDIATTDLTLSIGASGKFHVGRVNPIEGGALQVGNVVDRPGHSVSFSLELNGEDALFEVGPRGFLGAGVGFVRPILYDGVIDILPSQSLVNNTFNVSAINFLFLAGEFDVSRIYDADDPRSSVFAISADSAIAYTVDYALPTDLDSEQEILRADNFTMYGGSNFVKIATGEGAISPIVRADDGQSDQPRMEVGIAASTDLQDVQEPAVTGDADLIFNALRTMDATDNERENQFARVNIAEAEDSFKSVDTAARVGAIIGDTIVRGNVFDVAGPSDTNTNKEDAIEDGAGFAIISGAVPQIIAVSNIIG